MEFSCVAVNVQKQCATDCFAQRTICRVQIMCKECKECSLVTVIGQRQSTFLPSRCILHFPILFLMQSPSFVFHENHYCLWHCNVLYRYTSYQTKHDHPIHLQRHGATFICPSPCRILQWRHKSTVRNLYSTSKKNFPG